MPLGAILTSANVLPDSRARAPNGSAPGFGLTWVPIFCANCGASGGRVPECNMTFAFYLCQKCADSWGDIAHTYMEPDAVFWKRVHDERLSAAEAAKLRKVPC